MHNMQKQKLPTVERLQLVAGVGLRLLGALHDTYRYIKLELNCISADFGGIYKIHSQLLNTLIIYMTALPKTGDECRTTIIMATKLVLSSADKLSRCSAHSHRAVSLCVPWPFAF